MASGPEVPNSSVWPSGRRAAPRPRRRCCRRRRRGSRRSPAGPGAPAISAAEVRAIASVGPPGGNGMIEHDRLGRETPAACAVDRMGSTGEGAAAGGEDEVLSSFMVSPGMFCGCASGGGRLLRDRRAVQSRPAPPPMRPAGRAAARGAAAPAAPTRCAAAEPPRAPSQAMAMALTDVIAAPMPPAARRTSPPSCGRRAASVAAARQRVAQRGGEGRRQRRRRRAAPRNAPGAPAANPRA